jgi:hypothetical protein
MIIHFSFSWDDALAALLVTGAIAAAYALAHWLTDSSRP